MRGSSETEARAEPSWGRPVHGGYNCARASLLYTVQHAGLPPIDHILSVATQVEFARLLCRLPRVDEALGSLWFSGDWLGLLYDGEVGRFFRVGSGKTENLAPHV